MLFNPDIFSRELRRLLGNGAEEIRANLALELHAKGLFHVRREKGLSTLEELAETIEDPTIAKEFGSKSRDASFETNRTGP